MSSERIDHTAPPSDYEDLYRKYFDYVTALVRRHGILDDASAEDVAADILMRFFQKDYLSIFDPTMTFEYHGESRPAKFKSFLSKVVLSYLRGYWDKQKRLMTFEPLLCDRPMSDLDGGPRVTWLDLHAEDAADHALDVIEGVDSGRLIAYLRGYLKTIPRRSRFDQCDLVALFDAIVEQVLVEDRFSVTALRERFGVGPTAMHSWIWWLRENLAEALGRDLPAKRPCNRDTP